MLLSADKESPIDHTEITENSYLYSDDDNVHLYSDSYDAPSPSGALLILRLQFHYYSIIIIITTAFKQQLKTVLFQRCYSSST